MNVTETSNREIERHLRVTHFDSNPPHAKSIRCTCGDSEFSSISDWTAHKAAAFELMSQTLHGEEEQ